MIDQLHVYRIMCIFPFTHWRIDFNFVSHRNTHNAFVLNKKNFIIIIHSLKNCIIFYIKYHMVIICHAGTSVSFYTQVLSWHFLNAHLATTILIIAFKIIYNCYWKYTSVMKGVLCLSQDSSTYIERVSSGMVIKMNRSEKKPQSNWQPI